MILWCEVWPRSNCTELRGSSAMGVNGNQSNNSATNSGASYVFVRSGTNWTRQAYLKASNSGIDDFFGPPVSLAGGTWVVGAPYEASNAIGVNGGRATTAPRPPGPSMPSPYCLHPIPSCD
jgi:hypothetical protein